MSNYLVAGIGCVAASLVGCVAEPPVQLEKPAEKRVALFLFCDPDADRAGAFLEKMNFMAQFADTHQLVEAVMPDVSQLKRHIKEANNQFNQKVQLIFHCAHGDPNSLEYSTDPIKGIYSVNTVSKDAYEDIAADGQVISIGCETASLMQRIAKICKVHTSGPANEALFNTAVAIRDREHYLIIDRENEGNREVSHFYKSFTPNGDEICPSRNLHQANREIKKLENVQAVTYLGLKYSGDGKLGKALPYLRAAALAGSVECQMELIRYGDQEIEPSIKKHWIQKFSEKKYEVRMNWANSFHRSGYPIYAELIYNALAKEGNKVAQIKVEHYKKIKDGFSLFKLGCHCLRSNKSAEVNMAKEYFEDSAKQEKSIQAIYMLGLLYANAQGGVQTVDFNRAGTYMCEASLRGLAEAQEWRRAQKTQMSWK